MKEIEKKMKHWLQTMIHQLFVSKHLLFTSVNVKPMENSLGVKKASHSARRFLFPNSKKNNPITKERNFAQISGSICV